MKQFVHEFGEDGHDGPFAVAHGLESVDVLVTLRSKTGENRKLYGSVAQDENILLVTPDGSFREGDRVIVIG